MQPLTKTHTTERGETGQACSSRFNFRQRLSVVIMAVVVDVVGVVDPSLRDESATRVASWAGVWSSWVGLHFLNRIQWAKLRVCFLWSVVL